MAEPFLSEIRLVSFNYPPKGWAFCNGQLLPINQNQALFALVGTTYGGNGLTTFGLPNLQGRVIVGMGNSFTIGQAAGETAHTVNLGELPAHSHTIHAASAIGNSLTPHNQTLAASQHALGFVYGSTSTSSMDPNAVSAVGGSQPHNNMQPYLVLSYIIALQGIFPSQN